MLRQWLWTSRWQVIGRHRFTRRRCAHFLATTAPTHLVLEACGTAHYWGRPAQAQGHTVTLLPPAYVRPYVRRNKTDRTDAEALLEAVRSGEIPRVPVKRVEQQALVALHRIRAQWVGTRPARLNALRGLLREHGVLLPAGPRRALQLVPGLLEDAETPLPLHLRQGLASVHAELRALEERIADLERQLRVLAEADPVIARLRTIPGGGLLTAPALVGTVGHIHACRRARQFASWLGLPPRAHSSGQRRQLGGISNEGTSICGACSRMAPARGSSLPTAGGGPRSHCPGSTTGPCGCTTGGSPHSHGCGGHQTRAARLGGLAPRRPVRAPDRELAATPSACPPSELLSE